MHMHIPLSYPEFPLQPAPNLRFLKTAESLTSVTAVALEESDFDETRAFRGLFC